MREQPISLRQISDRPSLRRQPVKRHSFRRQQSGDSLQQAAFPFTAETDQHGESAHMQACLQREWPLQTVIDLHRSKDAAAARHHAQPEGERHGDHEEQPEQRINGREANVL